jgi:hypothetical protein
MTPNELPADVRRFILTSIPSVPYLEAVLLLRSEPTAVWTAGRLARRLYVPERTGVEVQEQLRASGVARDAATGDGVCYGPPPELREVIDRLAQAYAADLVLVTDLIHSRIDRRAQQFADAFRFRKE